MLPSIIRTLVPLVVGQLVAFFALLGVHLTGDDKTALTSGVGALIGLLYYVAARFLEQKFPWATALLGSSVQPVAYAPAVVVPPATVTVTADAAGTPTVDQPVGKHEAPGV